MISATPQPNMRQKSSIFIVLIPCPFFIRLMVALLILCLLIRAYVVTFNRFNVAQNGA